MASDSENENNACPLCRLSWSSEAILRDHLVIDHGADPEAIVG